MDSCARAPCFGQPSTRRPLPGQLGLCPYRLVKGRQGTGEADRAPGAGARFHVHAGHLVVAARLAQVAVRDGADGLAVDLARVERTARGIAQTQVPGQDGAVAELGDGGQDREKKKSRSRSHGEGKRETRRDCRRTGEKAKGEDGQTG